MFLFLRVVRLVECRLLGFRLFSLVQQFTLDIETYWMSFGVKLIFESRSFTMNKQRNLMLCIVVPPS